jgi:hypothetical protein
VSPETRDLVTWVLGTIVTGLVVVGFAVRYVLVPYLRDHLVRPVEDVRKQVSENSHTNTPATLPDRIEDVHAEISALARVLEGHLESSDRWLDALFKRIERLENRVGHHLREHMRQHGDKD